MLTWTLQWIIQHTVTDAADEVWIRPAFKPFHIIKRHCAALGIGEFLLFKVISWGMRENKLNQ